ncbi:MAG: hypothetical protein M1831_001546 [Alyxoria varia]|nr:MAG: hypothetical protein M1831_001546 [Alyxoria varia]
MAGNLQTYVDMDPATIFGLSENSQLAIVSDFQRKLRAVYCFFMESSWPPERLRLDFLQEELGEEITERPVFQSFKNARGYSSDESGPKPDSLPDEFLKEANWSSEEPKPSEGEPKPSAEEVSWEDEDQGLGPSEEEFPPGVEDEGYGPSEEDTSLDEAEEEKSKQSEKDEAEQSEKGASEASGSANSGQPTYPGFKHMFVTGVGWKDLASGAAPGPERAPTPPAGAAPYPPTGASEVLGALDEHGFGQPTTPDSSEMIDIGAKLKMGTASTPASGIAGGKQMPNSDPHDGKASDVQGSPPDASKNSTVTTPGAASTSPCGGASGKQLQGSGPSKPKGSDVQSSLPAPAKEPNPKRKRVVDTDEDVDKEQDSHGRGNTTGEGGSGNVKGDTCGQLNPSPSGPTSNKQTALGAQSTSQSTGGNLGSGNGSTKFIGYTQPSKGSAGLYQTAEPPKPKKRKTGAQRRSERVSKQSSNPLAKEKVVKVAEPEPGSDADHEDEAVNRDTKRVKPKKKAPGSPNKEGSSK